MAPNAVGTNTALHGLHTGSSGAVGHSAPAVRANSASVSEAVTASRLTLAMVPHSAGQIALGPTLKTHWRARCKKHRCNGRSKTQRARLVGSGAVPPGRRRGPPRG